MMLKAPFDLDTVQPKTYTVTQYHPGSGTTTVKTVDALDPIAAAKATKRQDPYLDYRFTDNHDGTVSITVATGPGARYPDHYTYTVHVTEKPTYPRYHAQDWADANRIVHVTTERTEVA